MDTLQTVIDSELAERLKSAPVAWISTVGPDATPHITPVWFDCTDGELIVFAQPGDPKVRNLRERPDLALGVPFHPDAGQVAIVRGVASLVDEPDREQLPDHYLAKYQAQIDAYGWHGAALNQQYTVQIRIQPTRVIGW